MIISAGRTVAITYTLTLDNGDTIDSNVDGEPLTYTHGTETLIAGLEKALEGLRRGDSATVHIPPARRRPRPHHGRKSRRSSRWTPTTSW